MSIEKCSENHGCMQAHLPLHESLFSSGLLNGADTLHHACRCLWLLRRSPGFTQRFKEDALCGTHILELQLILFIQDTRKESPSGSRF